MRVVFLFAVLLMTSCAVGGGMPQGAVAGCGNFEYTGTWTKSHTDMRVLWLSEKGAITVDEAIKLAEAVGCNE